MLHWLFNSKSWLLAEFRYMRELIERQERTVTLLDKSQQQALVTLSDSTVLVVQLLRANSARLRSASKHSFTVAELRTAVEAVVHDLDIQLAALEEVAEQAQAQGQAQRAG